MTLLCRVLRVSRSGYYKYEKRNHEEKKMREIPLINKVGTIQKRAKGSYGAEEISTDYR
jgi:hypothetical protein